jgi:hypothetical protein
MNGAHSRKASTRADAARCRVLCPCSVHRCAIFFGNWEMCARKCMCSRQRGRTSVCATGEDEEGGEDRPARQTGCIGRRSGRRVFRQGLGRRARPHLRPGCGVARLPHCSASAFHCCHLLCLEWSRGACRVERQRERQLPAKGARKSRNSLSHTMFRCAVILFSSCTARAFVSAALSVTWPWRMAGCSCAGAGTSLPPRGYRHPTQREDALVSPAPRRGRQERGAASRAEMQS